MAIAAPDNSHIPALRELWKLAFGDTDAFLDLFFETAFSPERCRCVTEDSVVAALYWFDCCCGDRKMAYLYAVATHPAHRGKGLCRRLMADTHALLAQRGYAGALLVPQEAGLRNMYAGMGYRDAAGLGKISCTAAAPTALQRIHAEEYALLRRRYLPEGGVIQEKENLDFLSRFASFYAGEDFLLTRADGENIELLGNPERAPGILGALGLEGGTFRVPGNEIPFAMFLPLEPDVPAPSYFGLAFD